MVHLIRSRAGRSGVWRPSGRHVSGAAVSAEAHRTKPTIVAHGRLLAIQERACAATWDSSGGITLSEVALVAAKSNAHRKAADDSFGQLRRCRKGTLGHPNSLMGIKGDERTDDRGGYIVPAPHLIASIFLVARLVVSPYSCCLFGSDQNARYGAINSRALLMPLLLLVGVGLWFLFGTPLVTVADWLWGSEAAPWETVDAFYYPNRGDLTEYQFAGGLSSVQSCRDQVHLMAARNNDPGLMRGSYECGVQMIDTFGTLKVYRATVR